MRQLIKLWPGLPNGLGAKLPIRQALQNPGFNPGAFLWYRGAAPAANVRIPVATSAGIDAAHFACFVDKYVDTSNI
jgi:hypothetical protein